MLIALLLALPVYYGIQDLIDEGDLSRLGNNVKNGLSNGAILALIAIGYTLVYGIIELINFAHGEVFMIGTVTSFGFFGTLGLTAATGPLGTFVGIIVTLLLAMAVCGTLNVMIERVAYRPLRGAPKLAPLITAIGMSFILQNVGQQWIGSSHRGVPDLIHSQDKLVDFLGINFNNGDLLAAVVTIPLVILLISFINQQPDGPRDARHGAGSRGGAPAGHQRGHHDRPDLPGRRHDGRRRRHRLRPLPDGRLVLPGLHRRPARPSPPRCSAASATSRAPCWAA